MTPLIRQLTEFLLPLSEGAPEAPAAPRFDPIDGDQLPEPYRTLLVHRQDMTSTLEAFWKTTLHLHVLDKRIDGDSVTRQVVLRSDQDRTPVEFGAIRIRLGGLLDVVVKDIVACRHPLGAILIQHGVEFMSQPIAYFTFECDETAARAFDLNRRCTLYGRRNELTTVNGVLAEVVEILPPIEPA